MNKLAPYAKTIVALIVAGLTALYSALSDDVVTTSEWVLIVLAALGAIGVYVVPNSDTPGKHAAPEGN